jgi:hypothetical protein
MRIIRGQPAGCKPAKIICRNCGKQADEAGIALPDFVAVQGEGIGEPDERDERFAPRLCEDCLTALEREEAGR